MSGVTLRDPHAAHAASPEEADRLLIAFLEGGGGPEAEERALGELISAHAEPLITAILRRRMTRSEDGSTAGGTVEDLRGQVVLRLLRRLRASKESGERPIEGFAAYVAVTTYRTFYEHLRGLHPERHRLKNRLRYVLTHAPTLSLWPGMRGRWLCGLSEWRGRPEAVSVPPGAPAAGASLERRPVEFLSALFVAAGGPLDLDGLVDRVAEVCGLGPRGLPARVPEVPLDSLASGLNDTAIQADDRLFLEQLWGEIRLLPAPQRQALLLALKDGEDRGTLELLPLTGVASLREIAAALELSAAELAGLWDRLPLDDRAIAGMMGLERQQVANLRLAARRRLARRLGLSRSDRPQGRPRGEGP